MVRANHITIITKNRNFSSKFYIKIHHQLNKLPLRVREKGIKTLLQANLNTDYRKNNFMLFIYFGEITDY